jgi:hypothetical protein
LNSNSFAANVPGSFGNVGSFFVVGPGYFDIDLSLSGLPDRRESAPDSAGRVLQRPESRQFHGPDEQLGNSTFGVILAVMDPRILQFSMKYTF